MRQAVRSNEPQELFHTACTDNATRGDTYCILGPSTSTHHSTRQIIGHVYSHSTPSTVLTMSFQRLHGRHSNPTFGKAGKGKVWRPA